MGRFDQRSSELEMMDYPIENKSDIFVNFKELVFINKWLGGPVHSFKAIKKMSKHMDDLLLADIGSGAGDFVDYMLNRGGRLKSKLKIAAVDMMPEAHEFFRNTFSATSKETTIVEMDYRKWFLGDDRPDIIHASLFCHHLTDDELIEFFNLTSGRASIGVVVNDLHRHPLAYHSIRILTKLFSKSAFTKNDAPLSVLRGFKRQELEALLQKAGVEQYTIKWKWAFRYLIIIPAHE